MIVYTDKHKIPFQIDDDDFETVSRYSWFICGGYVAATIGKQPKQQLITLHNFLLGPAPKGFEWDHENRDRLDYRRHNLRPVTRVVQMRNRTPWNKTTGIAGVHEVTPGTWRVRISLDSKEIKHIGYFRSLEKAAEARFNAEEKYWGVNR